jgi:GntR family transcriptional repressor for pyruvate dehydrogenase complex
MRVSGNGRGGAPVRPIRRRNVSHELVERLQAEILSGRLQPGARLPSERELSERYGVSRSSVREAIKTLESRGLVEGRQGKGTFVRPQGLEHLVQPPAGPVSVNEAEVRHLFEVREILEPAIVRLAAARARRADFTALRRLLEQQVARVEAGTYSSDDDARFHVRLARITGNPVLIRLMEGVMHLLGVVREPALRAAAASGNLRVRLEGHWEVLRALEARDADAAAERVMQHLAAARALALRVLREQGRAHD